MSKQPKNKRAYMLSSLQHQGACVEVELSSDFLDNKLRFLVIHFGGGCL